jgi:hypothetical protein
VKFGKYSSVTLAEALSHSVSTGYNEQINVVRKSTLKNMYQSCFVMVFYILCFT